MGSILGSTPYHGAYLVMLINVEVDHVAYLVMLRCRFSIRVYTYSIELRHLSNSEHIDMCSMDVSANMKQHALPIF